MIEQMPKTAVVNGYSGLYEFTINWSYCGIFGTAHHWLGHNRRGDMMMKSTKLRLFGGAVLIFNLWLIGHYNLSGIPVLLLTFGFAIGYELLVVRPSSEKGGIKK